MGGLTILTFGSSMPRQLGGMRNLQLAPVGWHLALLVYAVVVLVPTALTYRLSEILNVRGMVTRGRVTHQITGG